MNVRSFVGRNTREAMSRVRAALGGEAIVLKNRAVPGGVEILAMADDARIEGELPDAPDAPDASAAPDLPPAPQQARPEAARPMSTLTFQQFVRDRLARRNTEPGAAPPQGDSKRPATAARTAKQTVASSAAPIDPLAALQPDAPNVVAKPATAKPATAKQEITTPVTDKPAGPQPMSAAPVDVLSAGRPAGAVRAAASQPVRTPPTLTEVFQSTDGSTDSEVINELRAMRGLIATQLSSLAWFDGVRRNPLQVKLLRKLIGCGFSTRLSHKLIARLPSDFADDAADRWLRDALARLIAFEAPGATLGDRGGIYALVGPTGVGKTTTAAKIAAQFALRHGPQSVGLLTVDAYRIGAQDQLRTFGRLLGVPVHVAHDAGTLAEFLHLFMNKKLVLIDTVGVGQRDQRLSELMASLGSRTISKLLVLNAAAQPETLEDVITAYRAEAASGVVVSKVDEAVKTGGVLDCVIRHRLRLVGVANGQRVPEDWQQPDPAALVNVALTDRIPAAFDLDDNDLSLMLAGPLEAAAARTGTAGQETLRV
jgi:flagellar biosynthesis protein FlhF